MKKLYTIITFIFFILPLYSQNNQFEQDSINSNYLHNFRQINYLVEENIQARNLASESLIKAKEQIFTGLGLQLLSGGYAIVISQNNNIINKKYHYYTASIVSLIGIGFEISGINNIGVAGVQLNGNEISIRIKF